MDVRQSRNFACAVRRDWKEVVRCSSSRSSWVFSSWSCGTGSCVTSTAMCEGRSCSKQNIRTLAGAWLSLFRGHLVLCRAFDAVNWRGVWYGSFWRGCNTECGERLHVPTRFFRASRDIELRHTSNRSLMSRICRTRLRVPHVRCYSLHTRFIQAQSLERTDSNDAKGFNANEPAILRKDFSGLPAISKWFTPSATDADSYDLRVSYLEQHGASTVPLELTRSTPDEPATFERFEAPFSLLLAHMTGPPTPNLRIYLAQHSLADLPAPLQADVPTPAILTKLGRGDIYASSLWMGRPPTRTPLHRDPNPNLFVQLAGQKIVRLMRPDAGRGVYERARLKAGGSARANMRGEEMMVGAEMQALEEAVWDGQDEAIEGVEAQLAAGDGLYIPLGWWHAVRGIGTGANASVSGHTQVRGHKLTLCRSTGGSDERCLPCQAMSLHHSYETSRYIETGRSRILVYKVIPISASSLCNPEPRLEDLTCSLDSIDAGHGIAEDCPRFSH